MQTGVAIIKRKGYNSEAKEAVSIDPQRGKLNCIWKLGFSLHRCFVKSSLRDLRGAQFPEHERRRHNTQNRHTESQKLKPKVTSPSTRQQPQG
jgi:hypothetical protein